MAFPEGTWPNDTPSTSLKLYFLFEGGGGQTEAVFPISFPYPCATPNNEPGNIAEYRLASQETLI